MNLADKYNTMGKIKDESKKTIEGDIVLTMTTPDGERKEIMTMQAINISIAKTSYNGN